MPVQIEITKELPTVMVAEDTYKIEGSVKLFGVVGAPPFVYAQVRRKEWYKPDWAEEKDYIRGWPLPITGSFTIEFTPEKESHYEVKVVATPAPLSLPAIGVFPILAESDVMKVEVGEEPTEEFTMMDGYPVADPKYVLVDEEVKITSRLKASITGTYRLVFHLYEEALVGHGDELYTPIEVSAYFITGEWKDVSFTHLCTMPPTGPTGVDIHIDILDADGNKIWEDEYGRPFDIVAAPVADFEMMDGYPVADPKYVQVNQKVKITSRLKASITGTYRLVFILYEEALVGHGDQLYPPIEVSAYLVAGQWTDVSFTLLCTMPPTGPTGVDIHIDILDADGNKIWEDEYGRPFDIVSPEVDFTIGDLTVTPQEGPPGTNFELKFAVTNNSGVPIQGEIEVLIRQGEWLAPGQVLDTKTAPLILAGGQTGTITLHHVGQKTYTGDDEEDERDVDVNIYVAGELVAERDWRYGDDGFIFGIIEVPKLAVVDVTVSPLSGDRWTNFNIVTNVYNVGSVQQAFDLQIDIVVGLWFGIADTKYYQGFTIGPNTVLPIATNWSAYGVVDAGSYRVNAKVLVNGELIASKMSATFEVASPTVGDFAVAPYSWPDLFPYPEATQWGAIWNTPEGAFSSGIFPKSQLVYLFANVPLTGQLTMIFYAPGYHETFGPTAQVTLEDGAAYWYHWTNNTLVKS